MSFDPEPVVVLRGTDEEADFLDDDYTKGRDS